MAEYVSIMSYSKPNGEVDWPAYRAAKTANGEICTSCGGVILWPKGLPSVCHECKRLQQDTDAISHDRFIRCPKCRHHYDPGESDQHELFADGEHTAYCPNCSHEFEISTDVSYSFESPALLTEASQHEDAEETEIKIEDRD